MLFIGLRTLAKYFGGNPAGNRERLRWILRSWVYPTKKKKKQDSLNLPRRLIKLVIA